MISRIRTYYDNLSRGYDALYGNDQLNKWHFIRQLVPGRQRYVLDVGCGTSLITRLISADFIVGLDISKQMIETGRAEKVCYVVGNAEKLPFKDKSFDLIYSITVLQDLEKRGAALSEWRRSGKMAVISVMKGRLNVSELSKMVKAAGFGIERYIDGEKDNIFLVI